MLGLLIAAVIVVSVLAVRAPLYALPAALLLLGFEGSIKMRLTVEDAPSAIALGAALIDLALFIGLAGLIASDRAGVAARCSGGARAEPSGGWPTPSPAGSPWRCCRSR